ncbi:MAG: DoxX family protein [Patescibacteria group bacterium]
MILTSDYIFLLSRFILGFYFLFFAFNNLTKMSMLAEYVKSKNVSQPKLAVLFTGLLLLIGGLSIILGFYIQIGVLALTLFFLPVTFIMHNFWQVEDKQMKMMEMINFMKNMAIWAGVLLLLFIPQPWPFSFKFF